MSFSSFLGDVMTGGVTAAARHNVDKKKGKGGSRLSSAERAAAEARAIDARRGVVRKKDAQIGADGPAGGSLFGDALGPVPTAVVAVGVGFLAVVLVRKFL